MPNEERLALAVKYLRESSMSFRKIVGQLNRHLFNGLYIYNQLVFSWFYREIARTGRSINISEKGEMMVLLESLV